MERGNSMALPAAKAERRLNFERLSGGLNLWELDYRLRRSESPEMKNLMWRDGALNVVLKFIRNGLVEATSYP